MVIFCLFFGIFFKETIVYTADALFLNCCGDDQNGLRILSELLLFFRTTLLQIKKSSNQPLSKCVQFTIEKKWRTTDICTLSYFLTYHEHSVSRRVINSLKIRL